MRAARAEIRLARRSALGADVVIVGYPGHIDMAAARRVARERPLVFNPLVSLEDTMVGDRGLVSERSLRARALRAIDRHAFRAADLVVADTAAHAAYFETQFDIPAERLAVCYVGAEDRLFRPASARPASSPCCSSASSSRSTGSRRSSRGVRMSRHCVPHRRERPARRGPRQDPGECSSRALGGVRPASRSVPLRGMRARHLRHVGEGGTRHPEQGLPGARDSNAADHRGHTRRARTARGRARRTPRASAEPGSAGRWRYAVSPRSPRSELEHRSTRE